MDINHYQDLISISREISDQAVDQITQYCSARYCGVGNDTEENQTEDYLFIALKVSENLFRNALIQLDPSSQEKIREDFIKRLRYTKGTDA